VAHAAARWGKLPANFDQWDLACNTPLGWTVAHEAASSGTLPRSFDRWDIKTEDGKTVAQVALEEGSLSKNNYISWQIKKTLDEVAVDDSGML
jgi:hypothetical protein